MHKLPLKLLGDRALFILISWVFSITLTVFWVGLLGFSEESFSKFYWLFTATPYVWLIYTECFDMGHREMIKGVATLKRGFIYLALFQSISIIFLVLILAGVKIEEIFGAIYLAPFIGPRGTTGNFPFDIAQFLIFMGVESLAAILGYVMGYKDIILGKKKSRMSTK